MTRYALDEQRGELVASWGTGRGERCRALTALPAEARPGDLDSLLMNLTMLSEQLWHCYTHPASAAVSQEVNTEGWRRAGTRAGFGSVTASIRNPHLPYEDGALIVSYDPVVELSHRVGRALHAIDSPDLFAVVVAEVERELAAVEHAELGDLTGRAAQAVLLTRADASPVQVMAADALLEEDPLGSVDLFSGFDPTSAAVAAAHWLRAAAEVAAQGTQYPFTRIVEESDNIAALPHETPTMVLQLMAAGHSPLEAVLRLIRQAMLVADGIVADPEDLQTRIMQSRSQLLRHGYHAAEHFDEFAVRLTSLDPMRPARDLLEDLIAGISGCLEMYREGLVPDSDGEADDEYDFDAADTSFRAEVRARAAQDHARLI